MEQGTWAESDCPVSDCTPRTSEERALWSQSMPEIDLKWFAATAAKQTITKAKEQGKEDEKEGGPTHFLEKDLEGGLRKGLRGGLKGHEGCRPFLPLILEHLLLPGSQIFVWHFVVCCFAFVLHCHTNP